VKKKRNPLTPIPERKKKTRRRKKEKIGKGNSTKEKSRALDSFQKRRKGESKKEDESGLPSDAMKREFKNNQGRGAGGGGGGGVIFFPQKRVGAFLAKEGNSWLSK